MAVRTLALIALAACTANAALRSSSAAAQKTLAGPSQYIVDETKKAINAALQRQGGAYKEYSVKTVSWDDAKRGTVGGGLSSWGSNITDTYLKAKDDTLLFTVRPENFNEKLGTVTSDELAAVSSVDGKPVKGALLAPMTLRTILKNIGKYGGYAGLNSALDLSSDKLDKEISVRFQTTFLPVTKESGNDRATMEFATEAYNYQTRSDEDPKNLILLATSQGLAVQTDGAGAKKYFHHQLDTSTSKIDRFWLEAETTEHKVGHAQTETAAEREEALKRGKAVSSVIGVKGLGTHFNVLMTIQVPLKQKQTFTTRGGGGAMLYALCATSMSVQCDGLQPKGGSFKKCKSSRRRCMAPSSRPERANIGKASAARVSKGKKYDTVARTVPSGFEPNRHEDEHITATIQIYNAIEGGVPSEDDVIAAVTDLEELYKSVSSAKLGSAKFDFMKSELTVHDMNKITTKIQEQPRKHLAEVDPSQQTVTDIRDFNAFPGSEAVAEPQPMILKPQPVNSGPIFKLFW